MGSRSEWQAFLARRESGRLPPRYHWRLFLHHHRTRSYDREDAQQYHAAHYQHQKRGGLQHIINQHSKPNSTHDIPSRRWESLVRKKYSLRKGKVLRWFPCDRPSRHRWEPDGNYVCDSILGCVSFPLEEYLLNNFSARAILFGAGLEIPPLPRGWVYEGWVDDQSTGKFRYSSTSKFWKINSNSSPRQASGKDSDGPGPAAGPKLAAFPDFPGQEYAFPRTSSLPMLTKKTRTRKED